MSAPATTALHTGAAKLINEGSELKLDYGHFKASLGHICSIAENNEALAEYIAYRVNACLANAHELNLIRDYLKADENESTFDEVERHFTKLQKQRDHFIEVFKLIHQTCESVLNNRGMKEAELRNTFSVLKVMASLEKGRLSGSFIQTDEQRAHADRIFNELKGGSDE